MLRPCSPKLITVCLSMLEVLVTAQSCRTWDSSSVWLSSRHPIGLVKTFLELPCYLKLFLPNPPPPFTVRICNLFWRVLFLFVCSFVRSFLAYYPFLLFIIYLLPKQTNKKPLYLCTGLENVNQLMHFEEMVSMALFLPKE